jgi:hypothetical protein
MAKARKPDVTRDEPRARKVLEASQGPRFSKEQFKQIADHCQDRHLKMVQKRASFRAASRTLVNPLHEALLKDLGPNVLAAHQKVKDQLKAFADNVLADPIPDTPKFKPTLLPMSATWLGPPFPGATFSHQNGGFAGISDDGTFSLSSSSEGNQSNDPLVDCFAFFEPTADASVMFYANVQYSYTWSDQALGYPCHSSGRIGLSLAEVTSNGPQTLVDQTHELWFEDNPGPFGYPRFGNGAGLGPLFFFFEVQRSQIYTVEVSCTVHTDGDSGFLNFSSDAWANMSGKVTALLVNIL